VFILILYFVYDVDNNNKLAAYVDWTQSQHDI